ncbi:MAG: AarF/ABC1/UbiB kinase family protein [Deltaproteobacteria bacterium]|nr:AarF/ABC1/UbiB kinase family protein [Deltaproteobacteria bacterium]
MDRKKLPKSRLGRFARLAALGTRAGTGQLASLLGSKKAQQAVAEAAVDSLGAMRGLALKVGQMVSYVDGMVPAEHRDTYEEALKTLRAAAPTMSAEGALRVIESELGALPDELFDTWEPEPFASASIGQVHRARTHDGVDVAVKVQFEGIAKAVKADLANASLMGSLLGPLGSRIGVKEQLAEVRARFLEELDYRHEAARQMQFREVFAGDPAIRIPEIHDELSARRVLTSSFARGVDFEQACRADEDQRRRWAETLWRFVFSSLLNKGLFNADPHPGNYLFEPDGVVTFIDFGCTRVLSRDSLRLVQRCHERCCQGDLSALFEAALEMFGMPDQGPAADLARDFIHLCFTPIHTQGPYRITRQYAAAPLDTLRQNASKLLRLGLSDLEPMPAEWLFFNRLQFGFYSVLARLDVAADFNAIERQLVGAPPRS